MQGEDPDAVDLGAMPRQHRRRREKKLMTMEEVNEKFPLTKYKTWRSNRADQGLSTAGGINASSRPASIRDVPRESKEIESKSPSIAQTTFAATEDEKSAVEHVKPEEVQQESSSEAQAADSRPKTAQSQSAAQPDTPMKKVTTNDEGEEDDDQIQTAVPAAQLPDPGDACAICIDTIENDDDVRGLQCGHAFHASCVDPWLTSRRACCPLCKADYYVPKPRPEGADAEEARRQGRRVGEMPAPPQFAFMGGGGRRPTMVLPGRFISIVYDERDRYGFPRVVREPRPPRQSRSERRQSVRDERLRQMSTATTVNPESEQAETLQQPQNGWRQRLANVRIPNPMTSLRGNRENTTQETTMSGANADDQRTPGQVEAGRT